MMAATNRLIATSTSVLELSSTSVDIVVSTRQLHIIVNVILVINYWKTAKHVLILTSVQKHLGFAVSNVKTLQEGKFRLINS